MKSRNFLTGKSAFSIKLLRSGLIFSMLMFCCALISLTSGPRNLDVTPVVISSNDFSSYQPKKIQTAAAYASLLQPKLYNLFLPFVNALQASSDGTSWSNMTEIDVFESEKYGNEKILYPGADGNFNFKLKNDTSKKSDYKITFEDEFNYDIPMEYRLKKNGSYILGNENSFKKINSDFFAEYSLPAGSEDYFSLDWRWLFYKSDEEDIKDTNLGNKAVNENLKYTLKISVYASESGPVDPPRPLDHGGNKGDSSNNSEAAEVIKQSAKEFIRTGENAFVVLGVLIVLTASLLIFAASKKRNKKD